jgi:hypothetical protein
MKANLNLLASNLAKIEGGKDCINIAQIKELISSLGQYLRSVGVYQAIRIFVAIYRRAGKE